MDLTEHRQHREELMFFKNWRRSEDDIREAVSYGNKACRQCHRLLPRLPFVEKCGWRRKTAFTGPDGRNVFPN